MLLTLLDTLFALFQHLDGAGRADSAHAESTDFREFVQRAYSAGSFELIERYRREARQ